jgi:hypothetical protein
MPPGYRHLTSVLAAALALTGSGVFAADSSAGLELFEKEIRPLLLDKCIDCHGEKKQKGGLRLDSRQGWLTGGDSGPAIVPGKPEESNLFKAVEYEARDFKMPPKGKLPSQSIDAVARWIRLGASDPRTAAKEVAAGPTSPSVAEGRSFWSFQPIRKPPMPKPKDGKWSATDIDRFVLRKIEEAGLKPAGDADGDTMIRRLYFDLIGLPPTPEQIAAAGGRKLSHHDVESLVDELLASRHFGERWGRHWLDVVRFAESSGGGRTLLMPDAWRYRDYVIDAFNADMPYDRFVREQIAGDLMSSADWQEKGRQITATAFLVLGPANYELQDKDILEMDIVDEQLDTLGKAFMGMTIGCARCHDHKFDPIPVNDYYGMAGIFKSTRSVVHNNVSKWWETGLPLPPEQEESYVTVTNKVAALNADLAALKLELKEAGGTAEPRKPVRRRNSVAAASLPGIVVDDVDAKREGMWVESTSIGPYVGSRYLHDANQDKGAKSVTFAPKLPKAGRYEVQIANTPANNRSSNTPVTVHHAGGRTTVRVNQKVRSPIEGYRTSVGVFEFDPAKKNSVVISTEDTDNVVIADAVIFIPTEINPIDLIVKVPELPTPDQVDIPEMIQYIVPDKSKLAGIVVDNTEAELVGEWGHSVHTPPFVGAGYIHDAKEGKGLKSATFTPDIPKAGTYEVRISHNTNVRRSTNAPITIRHAGGVAKLRINEGEHAPINKLFRPLGTYRFGQGRNGSVTVSTEGTEGKYVIVDSVQFIRQTTEEDKAAEREKQRLEKRRARLQKEIKELEAAVKLAEADRPKRATAMSVMDEEADNLGDIPIAIRGVVANQGPIVPRSVMQVATLGAPPKISGEQSGRLEFAQWLTAREHPLTARVMVNRIWYWLFGQGLVRTVDNFGATGSEPTHPELLDHLAAKFVADGWSVKKLVRELVLSRSYRLASTQNKAGQKADPDNLLWWHMKRKRLDAESIRDALLLVGGTLDLKAGGPNIKKGTKSEYGYVFDGPRRSVYLPVFRNALPEIFETFDFADPNIQIGSRSSSTIAPQALLMMNSPFVYRQSAVAAKALLGQGELTTRERIDRVYFQVVGRRPSGGEMRLALRFVGDSNAAEHWQMLFQTLFQSIDFRYLK